MIKILNTLSGKKENLPAHKPLRLFVCGPTVYDYSHIGHARTYLAFDNIVRYLKSQKINVFYLQNITDIDDKIIERAKNQNKSPKELASHFEKEYRKDMEDLNATSVTKYAPASEYIKEILGQIDRLIKKDIAYTTDLGVYFEVKKFKEYGKLSKQDLDALRPGYRIEPDQQKKDPLDFALWKLSMRKPEQSSMRKAHTNKIKMLIIDGEPSWQSPWGWGRPGWHIEDTAISEKFFGPQYDIHGGAVDLKFPHHESEIAQQESSSGKKPFVKIWMHTGFLLINDEKMSKSLGNFMTIRDFLKKYSAETFRFLVASYHYRSPVNYTENLSEQSTSALKRIETFVKRLECVKKSGTLSARIKSEIKKANTSFKKSMDDDFNSPDALASIFNLLNTFEKSVWGLNKAEAASVVDFIREKMEIFGISFKKSVKIPLKISKMAEERELFRKNKQFIQSDALRKEIEALGYIIEDTPVGPVILKSD